MQNLKDISWGILCEYKACWNPIMVSHKMAKLFFLNIKAVHQSVPPDAEEAG